MPRAALLSIHARVEGASSASMGTCVPRPALGLAVQRLCVKRLTKAGCWSTVLVNDQSINQSIIMTRKITAVTARTQFGQIVDRAVDHNDRFLVERNGELAVLILSVNDFVKTLAPPPDWLKDIQDDAKRKGLDKLTMADIDAEIAAARRDRKQPPGK
jgi:hypothetical protein